MNKTLGKLSTPARPLSRQQQSESFPNISLASTAPARLIRIDRSHIKTAKLKAAIKDGFLSKSQSKK